MDWWKKKKFRIIQSRLRDIDAGMDVEKYVEELCEFRADICVVSCGGNTAFYPTELEYQRISPYLTDDFFGSLLQKCHDRKIKVIAGFDFGKSYTAYREQFYQRDHTEGQEDMGAVFRCEEYDRISIQQILDEVIGLYQIDGIFIENLSEKNPADEKKLRDIIRRHIRERRKDLLVWIAPETDKEDKIQAVFNEAGPSSRFMGQSLERCSFDLFSGIARGRHLLWRVSGSFETCPDRSNFDLVKKIFQFHKRFERMWKDMKSCSEILLIMPSKIESQDEYLGIHRILKESSLLFDEVLIEEARVAVENSDYQLVVFPGIEDAAEELMEKVKQKGALVLATGAAFRKNPAVIEKYFGVHLQGRMEQLRGSYMLTEPEEIFMDLGRRDWIFLDGDFYYMTPGQNNKNYLPLIRYEMRGENEYYTITDQSCISVKEGQAVYIPWMLGTLYETKGYEDYKKLFLDVLNKDCLKKKQMLEWKGAPYVEPFCYKYGDGYLLQMLNWSGIRGKISWPPLPVKIRFILEGFPSGLVQVLKSPEKKEVPFEGEVEVEVDGVYQAVLVKRMEQSVMEVQRK